MEERLQNVEREKYSRSWSVMGQRAYPLCGNDAYNHYAGKMQDDQKSFVSGQG